MTETLELGPICAAFVIAGAVLLWVSWPRDPCRYWCGRLDCEDYCRRRDRQRRKP